MKRTDTIGIMARRALVALSVMTLVGCTSVSPGWRDSVSASVDESFSGAPGEKNGKAIPSEVSSALLPPIEISLPQGGAVPLEPRFDLTVNNAPARQVFMGLVEGTPYSMILHPDVSGTISLNLKESTVPETLNVIRQVYGYEYRRDNNRFFILGSDMQTRMFPVNYLNLSRKGSSDTRVSASGLNATTGANSSGSSGSSGVQIQTQTQTDYWKDLTTALTAIVGADGGRKVIVNPQAGVILVRAMPDELRLVEDYLGITQTSMNRQVILEAKIIEVQLNNRFQSGINWSKVHGDYTTNQVGGGSPNLATTGTTPFTGSSGSILPGSIGTLQSSAAGTSAFGGVFTLTAICSNFTALVELLKAQGDLNVLSSPRVSTMNNQKAVIKVGTDSYFVTKQDSTASGVSGGSPTISTELSPFFSGIALDVTPQIDESGNIILHIHPSVSEVAEKQITVASNQTISTALSSVQESDNIVRANSGQIIVIGGLMKEGSTDDNASVPLLGDIPLIGNLFKHKKVTRIKRELVILLKPTIINVGQDWNDAAGQSQERIRKIRIGS